MTPSDSPRGQVNLIGRVRIATAGYPRQFWLLFWGSLLSAAGSSMIWPFMTIYMRQRLAVPLTTVTLLLTLNSLVGMAATFVAGPLVDRFGRKWAMVVGLLAAGLFYIGMILAGTVPAYALLIAASGAFGPLFGVGADSMIADMIEPERRAGAYSLIRMIRNAGVAIGPAVGGFVTAVSYSLAFGIAAGSEIAFALLILFFARETVPSHTRVSHEAERAGGYSHVFRDGRFVSFCLVYSLAAMAYSMFMVLLPVYGKENFAVPERQYGFILTVNALMVVFLQYAVTSRTQRFRQFPVLAVGSLFYAVGVGSIALGSGFPAFLLSMVILTIGEMIMIPTSTTLTANLAPPDMRGRYMSVYGLTWSVGFAVGPVTGGFLNDNVAPVAIWYGGLIVALLAAAGFAVLSRFGNQQVADADDGLAHG